MTAPPGPPGPSPALVPGEVRGYRRFRLTDDGLCPPVQLDAGPWSGPVERARCAVDEEHVPPQWGCGCGLYGWYHPSHTGLGTGWGNVTAVVAARGRVILGDSGFRAAAARVVAVSLPRGTGPRRRRRWERLLAERHPGVSVYRSRRRMVRRHPPEDLSGLGIEVRPSPAVRHLWTALALWLSGVLVVWSVAALSRGALLRMGPVEWLGVLACFVAWQATVVRLVCRASSPPAGGTRGEPPWSDDGGRGTG
ncbi:hypothetical protein SAMN05660464_4341 [Geodermatophilus dictyosporus]|uniref:Uncharacterized protein n=1 Tax=Geodermatophilus dictyosporus TaxID=1523247 RepID=A0A1I5THY6_9ACTN|nr:hypothetical protein [Geodermatophilus dictyosporus]SFP82635.1 hypothetical protein SAMN05660464_4341 [Geodermatophilus dictyosporus]